MIGDIFTVIWKEIIYLTRGSTSLSVILRYLAFVFIFGGIIPWQTGLTWLKSPLPILYWTWLAIYMASAATSGSFAREREQHTLETLLSTRLPDAAILLGKILTGVIYGGLLTLISLLLGQILLFIKVGNFYLLSVGVGGFFISLLAAFAIGTLASLTSIKAQTTRQAQSSLSLILLIVFLPLVIVQFIPGLQQQVLTAALKSESEFGCANNSRDARAGKSGIMVPSP